MRVLVIICILFGTFDYCFSQTLSGFVMDGSNSPIPFASVNVKNTENLGARSNLEGYYKFYLSEGQYDVVFSSIGFKSTTISITIKNNQDVEQNIYLNELVTELKQVEVKSKRSNVGYEIIKNVIANRSNLLDPFKGLTCEIYVKELETFEKKVKNSEQMDEFENLLKPIDIFEEEAKALEAKKNELEKFNLSESQIKVHFQQPNKVKEEKTAHSKIGRPQQLYLQRSPIFPKLQINFYKGLIKLDFLHETPIISPLHASGILSYKYRLKEIITEGKDTIYKIKVSPRSVGTSSLEGYLFVKKHEWALTKVDLTLKKGNLKLYDKFRIKQEYEKFDSVWLVTKQQFDYYTKYIDETVRGTSEIIYSNFKLNPTFPKKFFGPEVAVTIKEAYDRDTTYWNKLRPIPLTRDEQRKKFVQDSLKAVFTSEEYLDSIDEVFNKLTLLKVLYEGVGYRNREKKTQWEFSSLAGMISAVGVGAPRLRPRVSYFKKFENQQYIRTWINPSIGVLNGDIRGRTGVYHYYNPLKLSNYYVSYSHDLGSINWNTAWLDFLKVGNYFGVDNFTASHSFEIINGLRLFTGTSLQRRYPIPPLKLVEIPIINSIVDKGEPYTFEPYSSPRTVIHLRYTPFQKYIKEPYRKVVLGSTWPTFGIRHEKGWNTIFKSNIDFDYIALTMRQEISIGTLGKTKYFFTSGQFYNKNNVEFIDKKFFRRSDSTFFRYLMSDPTTSFQNLLDSYETEEWYGELHIIHHFNGAIINKVPFMKKTRIRSLAGAGFLYLPEYNNFFYQEAYIGIERNFKFLRSIIRPALYLVYSDSNRQTANLRLKFSFDIMNMRDMKFNF